MQLPRKLISLSSETLMSSEGFCFAPEMIKMAFQGSSVSFCRVKVSFIPAESKPTDPGSSGNLLTVLTHLPACCCFPDFGCIFTLEEKRKELHKTEEPWVTKSF